MITFNEKSTIELNEEIIYVSKSEIKRDAELLKKLGLELVKLGSKELSKIPLEENLLNAILLAKRIKKEGYRRQIQLIGKMLRNIDTKPIYTALDKLKNRHNQDLITQIKFTNLCDDLMATGDAEPIINIYPNADRQQLRTFARLAKKEQPNTSKSVKAILMYLKELDQNN